MALRPRIAAAGLASDGARCRRCFFRIAQVCVAEALRDNRTITELDLSGNRVTAAGAADLATALSENTTLTSVKLRDNQLENDGVTSVFAALLDNRGSKVECVDCRYATVAYCITDHVSHVTCTVATLHAL
jgi:Ran GTPase-activating protein (RanGAP) involved in mRNA processing and transport